MALRGHPLVKTRSFTRGRVATEGHPYSCALKNLTYLQLILKLPVSALDSISFGERIFNRCQPLYSVSPTPPSVQVVFTLFVPAASKSSVNTGAVAPSLRVKVYFTVPGPFAVMKPVQLTVTGH